MEIEALIAIPIFIHDFLCIHPFNDGNGRMSRLLTTLLLYRSGFYVGKYISLEAKIAKNKDLYYDALGKAQIGWHEETEDKVPFIKYLLGTILSAYRDFEDRFALVEKKQPAIEIVRQASMNKLGKFSKQDIRELCPSLSVSAIEGALRKMVDAGEIKREGNGKIPVIADLDDQARRMNIMNVEYIPPKPHYKITFQALEFCVSQIPSGQVETNDE